jgi:plastocyanin
MRVLGSSLAVLATLLVGACDSPTATLLADEFSLVRVNGKSLPTTLFASSQAPQTVTSEILSLGADGSFSIRGTYVVSGDTVEWTWTGQFSSDHHWLLLKFENGEEESFERFVGGATLRGDWNRGPWVGGAMTLEYAR